MELAHRLEALLTLAEEVGIDVRAEAMSGEGGGLCKLRGRWVLFVDTVADIATRYGRTISALAGRPELEGRFIPPEIREDLEQERERAARHSGRE